MQSLLPAILDWQNLLDAYAELAAQFDEQNKSNAYRGIDGVTLSDLETNATELITLARAELAENMSVDPVRKSSVPKPDGTSRPVYLFSLKDRLKAQAIHRVIEPLIESRLSPYLFSYRAGRSHHQAAKSVAKRHRKHHKEDTVGRIDLKQYIDHLDHDRMREFLLRFDIDAPVADRILRFASVARCEEEGLQYATKGSLAGNSLTPLLQNVYLNDVDLEAGRKVALYRRVGDDIILCDHDGNKVQHIQQEIITTCAERGLGCNEQKTVVSGPGQSFRFVGYEFQNGNAVIEPGAVHRIQVRFHQQLAQDNKPTAEKIEQLIHHWFEAPNCLHHQFTEILKSYPYADDDRQMKTLSQDCMHTIVRYLFGSYTPRHHRWATSLLQHFKLPLFYDYFRELRYGHTRFGSLAASAPRRYQNALQSGAVAL